MLSHLQRQESKIAKKFILEDAVDEAIQEMIKDKHDNPDLIIPFSFLEFYNRPEMLELLNTVYDYCKCLASISSKIISFRKEGKNNEAQRCSDNEYTDLSERGKTIAKIYGQLILNQRGLISNSNEQNFFETIIYFIIKVIKIGFTVEEGHLLDDELNRLFRGTAFNIAHRRKFEFDKVNKLPHLKGAKRDTESVINNIIFRHNNQHKNKNKSYSLDGITRPGFVKMSPYKAINSRSPLISLLLPSPKDKIRQFEELRRKIISKNQKLPSLIEKNKSNKSMIF